MPNISIGNYATTGSNDIFEHIWKLTRAIKYAGYTTLGSSDGTNTATGSNAGDLWGSGSNPVTDDIYPTNTTLSTGSWINFQGPSTLKIPISFDFTGSFIRGENVTQTDTGAQAELIGCNNGVNPVNGYLVLAPRVPGNSTGSLGWNVSNIVGSLSGESVLPIEDPQEYIRELVFWRGSNPTQGAIYYQCVLSGAVSSSGDIRFSQRTGSVGCTAAIAPGGGGTGNSFPPSGSLVALGTGGANTPANWSFSNYSGNYGFSQIMVVDATTGSLRSPDGTFNIAIGLTTTGTGAYSCFGFNRLDNSENGDVDPYVFWSPTSAQYNSRTTTVNTSVLIPSAAEGHTSTWGASYDTYAGFRRRGMSSGDSKQNFINLFTVTSLSTQPIGLNISTELESEATSIVPKRIKEEIWIMSYYNLLKMRKGTLRWIYRMAGGSLMQKANDTLDNKYWLQVANGLPGNSTLVIGPYDGVTTPLNG